jgi:outer membrane protein assembly factor BamB
VASRRQPLPDDVRRLFLSEGDDVVAVRASDGTEIWRSAVGRPDGPSLLTDGVLALRLGGRRGSIIGLDPSDGRALWRRRLAAHALSYLQAGGGGRLYLRVNVEGASIVQVRSVRDGTEA